MALTKMNEQQQALSPRGAEGAGPVRASSGQQAVPWWVSLRQGLQLTSQLVVASPVGLPSKVVQAAKYLSLALGVWESLAAQHRASEAAKGETDAP